MNSLDASLITAIRTNDLSVLKVLIAKGANLNHNKNLPLHSAVKWSSHEIVKELLKSKTINVDLQNDFGQTPLHLAIIKKDYTLARILDEVCDLNIKDVFGMMPMHEVWVNIVMEIYQELIKTMRRDLTLRRVSKEKLLEAASKSTEYVKRLSEKGGQIDANVYFRQQCETKMDAVAHELAETHGKYIANSFMIEAKYFI